MGNKYTTLQATVEALVILNDLSHLDIELQCLSSSFYRRSSDTPKFDYTLTHQGTALRIYTGHDVAYRRLNLLSTTDSVFHGASIIAVAVGTNIAAAAEAVSACWVSAMKSSAKRNILTILLLPKEAEVNSVMLAFERIATIVGWQGSLSSAVWDSVNGLTSLLDLIISNATMLKNRTMQSHTKPMDFKVNANDAQTSVLRTSNLHNLNEMMETQKVEKAENRDKIRALLAVVKDADRARSLGWTICYGHEDISASLIESGITVFERQNAIILATATGRRVIVKLLLEARFALGTYQKERALAVALNNGRDDIVKLLKQRQ